MREFFDSSSKVIGQCGGGAKGKAEGRKISKKKKA
jgi:hypothetical protein